MQIKLYLMGPLKQKLAQKVQPEPNCYLEVSENACPRDLLIFLGAEESDVLVLINGKPVDLDENFNEGDRVVLMHPDSRDTQI